MFRDKSRNEKLYAIKADRVIDFRAAYQFVSEAEQVFGSIKREGLRSSGRPPTTFKRPMVHPLPPFARRSRWPRSLMRSLVTFLWWGCFCNYVFNPSYLLTTSEGEAFSDQKISQPFW